MLQPVSRNEACNPSGEPTVLYTLSLFDPGANAASSPVTPVDGDVDLTEEEMEQSVFGMDSYSMLFISLFVHYIFGN